MIKKPFNFPEARLIKYLTTVIFAILLSTDLLYSQPDWPEEWMYRKPVVKTGTGNRITDYQIRVDRTAASFDFVKAQSDGGDILFTDEDGTTLLSYWIESWNSPVSAS